MKTTFSTTVALVSALAATMVSAERASTTRYADANVGACGCGSNGTPFPWQSKISDNVYTAAGSQKLYDAGGASWCGSGCGSCYSLTNTGERAGGAPGNTEGGPKGETIMVMLTNLCPAAGNDEWCSLPTNKHGMGAHFDIMQGVPGWDNPIVDFQPVACPGQQFGQCECASRSRVKRGIEGSTAANEIEA
ncbi:MAG: hypothetical protein M1817_001053 [Caeruleum heppii]|nr:MAG: hypothetical protein M1817_001053 [Caeruleum heppii]